MVFNEIKFSLVFSPSALKLSSVLVFKSVIAFMIDLVAWAIDASMYS